MRPSLKALIFHAVLLALMLLGLFMVRGMYRPLYYNELAYSLLTLAITTGVTMLCYSSLTPNYLKEEGTTSWYLARGWGMGLTGILLATLLVGTYAYQVDDGYFDRRMSWEEARIGKQNLSPRVEDILLEKQQEYQTHHFEEITMLFVGGLSVMVSAIGACLFFRGFRKQNTGSRQVRMS